MPGFSVFPRALLALAVVPWGGAILSEVSGSATTAGIEIPYAGSVTRALPSGWTAVECPVGDLPDMVAISCDESGVTFAATDYGPDVGSQQVIVRAATPSGSTQDIAFVVALAPPRLTAPADGSVMVPLGMGLRTTIPYSELRYECQACLDRGPVFVVRSVEPAAEVSARFTGLGLQIAPSPEFSGAVTVTFVLRDRFGQETEPVSQVLTVVAGDSALPVLLPDLLRTEVNQPVTGDTSANDVNVAGGEAMVTSCGSAFNGTVTCAADGSFRYVPNLGFVGVDQFAYRVLVATTGDQGVGVVVVGVGADPAAALEQGTPQQTAPVYAPPTSTPPISVPGVFGGIRDDVAQIPRSS